MKAQLIFTLIASSGLATAASTPILTEPSQGQLRHAGHIYYNIATGEKVTTLIDSGDVQDAVNGAQGSEIWIATSGPQCADNGFSSSFFFGIDDPTSHNCSGLSCELIGILFDWGDIAPDTVVDCVQIHWISDHADTDTDNDSNPDGVDGFAGYWTYWDAMNGRSPQLDSIALPIVQIAFYNLPGEYPIDTSTVVYYTADVDLGGSFASSLTFEIGDTDSNPQSAAVHNPRMDLNDLDSDGISDLDPDQDGLADWGWSVQFVQPGTIDVDNADSDSNIYTGIDGDPAAEELIAINFGSPTPGHAELNSQGEWAWISDGPTAGATEDAFALGLAEHPDGSGDITIAGTFYFGGFSCDPDPTTGQYTPAAHFQVVLYGPNGGCRVDLAGNPDGSPDGILNFIDISAFLSAFAVGNLDAADLAGTPDGNPDGLLNIFDVSAYLAEFALGCP